MAGDVRVVLKSVFDDTGIKQAQKQLGSISQNIDKAFKVAATAVAGATTAIGFFAKKSIDAASDLQESTNAVRVVYGDAADAILAIGETSATSLGVARNEFNQAAVRFSAFAERVVGSGGDMAGFIKDISQRATDFASVFNIDVAEALQVFQSGLSGEAEPLKRFGINLLESEVKAYALRAGIISVGDTMTETEKVQARYGLLMESTAKTAGDFANTSDGLANSQRILKASITDLQAEIGSAFLPVVEELFHQFSENLLPKLQELGEFLKSPKGQQAIKDFGDAFAKAFDQVFEFIDFIIKNSSQIFELAGTILAVISTLKVLNTVTKIVTTAQLLWNAALVANPIGLLIVTLGLAVIAVQTFSKKVTDAERAVEEQTNNTMKLRQEQIQLIEKIKQGGIEVNYYKKKLQELNGKLIETKTGFSTSAGEANRFNNIKLGGIRNEINKVGETIANLPPIKIPIGGGQYITPDQPNPYKAPPPEKNGGTKTDNTKEIASTIKEASDAIANAKKRYSDALKAARTAYKKAVEGANKAYTETVKRATEQRDKALESAAESNAQAVANINKTYTQKLADIVTSSINRLRDAYRQAVAVDVGKLFSTEEVGRSVDGLIKSLTDKLTASRQLLANSAALSAAGFSQTFIEQVVGAGTDTGNELAKAILEATPESQKELQSLFGAIESESNTGMDALSQTIYDKAGLATDALKTLYSDTQAELTTALADQASLYAKTQADIMTQFEETMTAAQVTRDEALDQALQDYKDAATQAAKDFTDSLDEIEKEFTKKLEELGAKKSQILGLQAEIDAAAKTVPAAVSTPKVVADTVSTPKSNSNTTVVNVNVKTDQTQSTSQVGKIIANTINKYVGTGGALKTGVAAV